MLEWVRSIAAVAGLAVWLGACRTGPEPRPDPGRGGSSGESGSGAAGSGGRSAGGSESRGGQSGGEAGENAGGATSSGGAETGGATSTGGTESGGGPNGGTGAATGGNAGATTGGDAGAATGGDAGGGGEGGGTENPPCVRVAPDGDDDAALASNGTLPFAGIAAAVSYAVENPELTNTVCIAAGPSCGAIAVFTPDDDITLRNGVSLYGRYESTSWTRCSDSETVIDEGSLGWRLIVRSLAATPSTFDGLTLRAKLEIRGWATVSDALIRVNTTQFDPGVLVQGGDATFLSSEIDVQGSLPALWITSGRVTLDDVVVHSDGGDAVVYESRTGLTIDTSELTAVGGGRALNVSYGTRLDVANSVLRAEGSAISARLDCSGNPPADRIADNRIECTLGESGQRETCVSVLECNGPVTIEGNLVSAYATTGAPGLGVIECLADPCLIARNDVAFDADSLGAVFDPPTGVFCAGSCTIRSNRVRGATAPGRLGSARGILAESWASSPDEFVIEANHVDPGCGGSVVGILADGSLRVRNNIIHADGCDGGPSIGLELSASSVLAFVEFNTIRGGIAVASSAQFASFIGNILRASSIAFESGVHRLDQFAWNDFDPSEAPTYFVGGPFGYFTTAEAVNALGSNGPGNFHSNFSADPSFVNAPLDYHLTQNSPCIDAGGQFEGPEQDFDGEPRVGFRDVGADEWSGAVRCPGITCAGPGVCSETGPEPRCICARGYANPPGDPLACGPDE